jgi:hypothetical protein
MSNSAFLTPALWGHLETSRDIRISCHQVHSGSWAIRNSVEHLRTGWEQTEGTCIPALLKKTT